MRTLLDEALSRCLVVVRSGPDSGLLAQTLRSLGVSHGSVKVLDGGTGANTATICRAAGVASVRIGRRDSLSLAFNMGARLAREGGAQYLLFVEAGIAFSTVVARELLRAMLDDPRLGAVTPAVARADAKGTVTFYRALWDLGSMRFGRDVDPARAAADRIEADFCELDCVLVRMAALDAVGLLDTGYDSRADADLGFRMRQAGWLSASLTGSRAERLGLGLEGRELRAGRQDRARFTRKHLDVRVDYRSAFPNPATSWGIVDASLRRCLGRGGLLAAGAPSLAFTHPGSACADHLFTVWETSRPPSDWLKRSSSNGLLLVASRWNRDVFEQAGFRNVHHVPLGVETDHFHPASASGRLYDEPTFLWFAHNQFRKGLDVMLQAWAEFRSIAPTARLVIAGHGVLGCLGSARGSLSRRGSFIVADYPEERVSVREIVGTLSARDLADLYRSVDAVVSTSRSEGFGLTVAEALACGTQTIHGADGGTRDFAFDGALLVEGRPARADYSDMGYGEVGSWWEPDTDQLVRRLEEVLAATPGERRERAKRGVQLIRRDFTWRTTCTALRGALAQDRSHGIVASGRASEPGWLQRTGARAGRVQAAFATARRQRGVGAGCLAVTALARASVAHRLVRLGHRMLDREPEPP